MRELYKLLSPDQPSSWRERETKVRYLTFGSISWVFTLRIQKSIMSTSKEIRAEILKRLHQAETEHEVRI